MTPTQIHGSSSKEVGHELERRFFAAQFAQNGGSGLTDSAKAALLTCFRHTAWTDANGSLYYMALANALNADPGYITAVYTQSEVITVYNDLDDFQSDLVVTFFARPDSTGEVIASADYTLSGTLTEGTSVIAVTYGTYTTWFTVTVSAVTAFNGTYFGTADYDVTISVSNLVYWTANHLGNMQYIGTSGDHTPIVRGNSGQVAGIVMYPIAIPTNASKVIVANASVGTRINLVRWNSDTSYWKCISPDAWNNHPNVLDLAEYRSTYGNELYFFVSCGGNTYAADKSNWVIGWA